MSNTDWNINSDIYDIVNSIKNVEKRYIEDEDESTLALGIFGFITDTEAKKIQTATIMAGQLGNEMFPTRAKLTKNILTHAAYNGIENMNAIPAKMTITLCVKTSDISEYGDGEVFYIDSKCPIFIQSYEFHIDYDIKITTKRIGGVTTYSAMYDTYDSNGDKITNRISDISNPYIRQPFTIMVGNDEYIAIQTTIRQCSIEEIHDTIISDSIIENKQYSFEFSNQIADFIVQVTDSSTGKTTELIPYMFGSIPSDGVDNYCYYIFTSSNSIRISFDSSSYIPGLNSEIYIKVYTTLGKKGNFEYLNIDQTSEGLYVTMESEDYDYKQLITYVVGVTDSTDGSDAKSIDELKRLIPKASMSRGSITTETDINNYFDLINNSVNRLVMQKKVDNQINRIWYAYFLLKDDNNNIIPSNTINMKIDTSKSDFMIRCEDGRYILPAGSFIRYDSVNKLGEVIDPSEVPILYSDKYFNSGYYYYMNLYNLVISREILYASYYLTACNYDSFFMYDYVNQDSDAQFIANRFHFSRNLLTFKDTYNINFTIIKSVNDGTYFPTRVENITRTMPDGSKIDEKIVTQKLRVILVLYREELPYRWMECTYDEESSYINSCIYNFGAEIISDSQFDNENRIKITGMNEVGSNTSVYGYIDESVKAKIYILNLSENYDTTVEYPRKDLDNIAPGYEDYVVTNIYEAVSGIQFFNNFTSITNTRIDNISGTSNNFIVKGMPVIGAHYLQSETEVKYLLEAVTERKAYIDYCISLVENNMNIDFKFFNTYGPSSTYKLEDAKTSIGSIDICLRFKLSLKDNADVSIVNDITKDIKDSIEDINNIEDWHAPNLITTITDTYREKINFFEFVGFNDFDADDQHIINISEDDPAIVPEFINIRNNINSETLELDPCIKIELV